MDSTRTGPTNLEDHPAADGPLPEFVDWILGALIAFGGLSAVVGGGALALLVDRELLAQGVEEGTITVTLPTAELTEPETLEVVDAVVSWTSIGLLVTGVGMVLFAVGYVVARHRAHRRVQRDEPVSSYSTFAVLGAVVTAVLSFLPFSSALGGALAGYLERGESDRTVSVGALAGFLPALPALILSVFVLGGFVAGLLAIDRGAMATALGAMLFLMVMLVASLSAGLGALGGYVGGSIAERRASTD